MTLRLAAIAAALTFGPAAVQATTSIDPSSYDTAGCLGAATCTIVGTDGTTATLTALPETGTVPTALFAEQDFRGLEGLGINFTTGGAEPEIQADIEGVRIEYDQDQVINEIRLGHFYHADSFSGGDEPDETAMITAFSGGSSVMLTIQRLDDTTFDLSYDDASTLLPTATWISSNPDQGLVSLTGLFPQLSGIDKLEFFAKSETSPGAGDDSDYSINLTTSVIPGPFGVLLLGTAFVAAGAVRRFGAKSAA